MNFRIAPTSLACTACSSLPADARCPERCARNFVLGGWSSSMKHSRDSGMIVATKYPRVMHEQIADICARPECRVLVAVGTSANVFGGFIAGEPDERIVYYVFVKGHYRRGGLSRRLFVALGIDPTSRFAYPCSTDALEDPAHGRLVRKIPRAVHDPAVARYPKSERHRSYA